MFINNIDKSLVIYEETPQSLIPFNSNKYIYNTKTSILKDFLLYFYLLTLLPISYLAYIALSLINDNEENVETTDESNNTALVINPDANNIISTNSLCNDINTIKTSEESLDNKDIDENSLFDQNDGEDNNWEVDLNAIQSNLENYCKNKFISLYPDSSVYVIPADRLNEVNDIISNLNKVKDIISNLTNLPISPAESNFSLTESEKEFERLVKNIKTDSDDLESVSEHNNILDEIRSSKCKVRIYSPDKEEFNSEGNDTKL